LFSTYDHYFADVWIINMNLKWSETMVHDCYDKVMNGPKSCSARDGNIPASTARLIAGVYGISHVTGMPRTWPTSFTVSARLSSHTTNNCVGRCIREARRNDK
jgi:hypothetical protein